MNAPTIVQFPIFEDANGTLGVFECNKHVPFEAKRIFVVAAKSNDVRGNHAHKKCTQLLICVGGKIRVNCDDGVTITKHLLNSMANGLLIPPGVWATQEYLSDDAVLMVLCDREYEQEDYIRDYSEFVGCIKKSRRAVE